MGRHLIETTRFRIGVGPEGKAGSRGLFVALLARQPHLKRCTPPQHGWKRRILLRDRQNPAAHGCCTGIQVAQIGVDLVGRQRAVGVRGQDSLDVVALTQAFRHAQTSRRSHPAKRYGAVEDRGPSLNRNGECRIRAVVRNNKHIRTLGLDRGDTSFDTFRFVARRHDEKPTSPPPARRKMRIRYAGVCDRRADSGHLQFASQSIQP
jgi:hypothetical protein